MEATHRRPPLEELRRMAGTRRGATLIALSTAALAALVLMTLLSHYKSRVQDGTLERPALVADRLIPKGTSGAVVVGDRFFKPTTVQQERLAAGALSGAEALKGKVATHDIYPGEQLTAAEFASGADPLRGQLTGTQRAIAVPIDAAHGLVGQARSGDKVDVLAGFNAADASSGHGRPELRTLAEDVLVLKAAEAAKSGGNAQNQVLTVRVSADQAAQLAFAADNGKVWFVLRPPGGAKNARPSSVTLDSLLTGAPTIEVDR
jgi:Flp pilus assembly protein CpaB